MRTNNHEFPLRLLLRLGVVGAMACIGFLLMTAPADAQLQIAESKTTINNEGSASADTGSNSGVGNDSENTSTNTQTASPDGNVLQNSSDETNDSDGTATIETGSATAVGNATHTVAVQTLGPDVEPAPLPASSGLGSGDPSPVPALDDVLPPGSTTTGGLAATTPQPGPVSTSDGPTGSSSADGSSIAGAGITTPPAASATSSSLVPETSGGIDNATASAAAAPAAVPMDNSVLGAVSGAGPPAGLTISDQTIRITNEGDAVATTGDNSVDDGDITTGNATAAGNRSDSIVQQAAAATGDLALIDQAARVRNDGDAVASTGDNDGGDITSGDATALGNMSGSTIVQHASTDADLSEIDQTARVSNDGDAVASTGDNDGGDITTGTATAIGNRSGSTVLQTAAATGDLALIDQAARVGNDGDAVADTGDNTADDGDVTTGNATAQGNVSSTTAEQRIAADASNKQLDQSLGASNEGAADALTGDNSAEAGEDGDVTIVTGTADAIGNLAKIKIGQGA